MSIHVAYTGLVIAIALLAGCQGSADRRDPPDLPSEAREAQVEVEGLERADASDRAYVDHALALVREHYHDADLLDWDELERVAHTRLAAAPTRAGAYVAITAVLSRIGDGHNQLLLPDAVAGFATDRDGELPEVTRTGDVIAIKLPAIDVNHDTFDDYARHALNRLAAMHDDSVCGWIVDLRDMSGGSMLPPLAALGHLLAGQSPLTLAYPDGQIATTVDFDRRGRMLVDARSEGVPDGPGTQPAELLPDLSQRMSAALDDLGDPLAAAPADPVAVLISPATASAGEAITVAFSGRQHTRSFGAPTHGLPTGPLSYELDDGALLRIAVARMTDRHGTVYRAPIPPDDESTDPDTDAHAWLSREQACRP